MESVTIVEPERIEPRQINFDEMLGDLAENMRLYDELIAKREPLLEAKEVADAQLEGLDLELPAEQLPEYVALNALEKVRLDKKIEDLDNQLQPYHWYYTKGQELLALHGLEYQKVEVQPVSERSRFYKIGGSAESPVYMGTVSGAKKGKIKDISLDMESGGSIVINGRYYSYEARGLVDRENGYQPAFSIQYIS